MKKEKEPVTFLFDGKMVLSRKHQIQVLTFVNLLSHIGLKAIEGMDWDNLTENAPIFEQIAGGKDSHSQDNFMRAAYACQEMFSRWKEQEAIGEDYKEELWVEDLEDALRIVHEFQDKLEIEKRGW